MRRFDPTWLVDAERLLSIIKSTDDDHPVFRGIVGGRQAAAQCLFFEATYFRNLALRLPTDWPEYPDPASQLQRLIDETRELIR